ncbi:linear amide C-N hydrolase [Aliarcobacter skirrowii]|uniref:linear amide C-N hydrolase n=1 Tax=Aliarcobacter skirrowii TaxID=28200 RepID=UPI00320B9997
MTKFKIGIVVSFLMFQSFTSQASACSRVIYEGADSRFITARSMDWKENIPTSLWVFPKGMIKDGGIDENSIKWTSKYGSVVTVGYEAATNDGMNEKGLVANLLYLVESDYGTSSNPTMSIAAITQYVLDNFASVKEAVETLEKPPYFQIIAPSMPKGEKASLHLSISDAKGDSAIIEFIKGKMVIHHSKEYKTMTNSPIFEEQLAISGYWKLVDGKQMLPGTYRAADRFARASYYTNTITPAITQREAVSTAFSIIRNVSVPRGISSPSEPNVASTLWRTVSDQKSLQYYFDSATSPSVFWVDISKLDLKKGAKVKKLDLTDYPTYSGEVSAQFKEANPFKWLK